MTDEPPQYPPPAPPQGWPQPPAPPPGPLPEPKSRDNVGLMVGLLALVLVLGLGGLVAALALGRSSSEPSSSTIVDQFPFPPTSTVGVPDPFATTAPPGPPPSAPPGGPVGPVERPPVPEGYQLLADDEKGFAFVMPKTWSKTELTADQLQALADRLRPTNPNLAAAVEQFKSFGASGGLAFAYGPPGAITPTLNLLGVASGGLTLDQIVAQVELGLGSVNAKVLEKTPAKVGGRDALMVSIEVTVAGQGTVKQKQLFVADEAKVYVFTVAGADDATAETILNSLRLP